MGLLQSSPVADPKGLHVFTRFSSNDPQLLSAEQWDSCFASLDKFLVGISDDDLERIVHSFIRDLVNSPDRTTWRSFASALTQRLAAFTQFDASTHKDSVLSNQLHFLRLVTMRICALPSGYRQSLLYFSDVSEIDDTTLYDLLQSLCNCLNHAVAQWYSSGGNNHAMGQERSDSEVIIDLSTPVAASTVEKRRERPTLQLTVFICDLLSTLLILCSSQMYVDDSPLNQHSPALHVLLHRFDVDTASRLHRSLFILAQIINLCPTNAHGQPIFEDDDEDDDSDFLWWLPSWSMVQNVGSTLIRLPLTLVNAIIRPAAGNSMLKPVGSVPTKPTPVHGLLTLGERACCVLLLLLQQPTFNDASVSHSLCFSTMIDSLCSPLSPNSAASKSSMSFVTALRMFERGLPTSDASLLLFYQTLLNPHFRLQYLNTVAPPPGSHTADVLFTSLTMPLLHLIAQNLQQSSSFPCYDTPMAQKLPLTRLRQSRHAVVLCCLLMLCSTSIDRRLCRFFWFKKNCVLMKICSLVFCLVSILQSLSRVFSRHGKSQWMIADICARCKRLPCRFRSYPRNSCSLRLIQRTRAPILHRSVLARSLRLIRCNGCNPLVSLSLNFFTSGWQISSTLCTPLPPPQLLRSVLHPPLHLHLH